MKVIKFVSSQGKLLCAVILAAAVGGAATAVVSASIPDSSGTIHACYNKNTGTVKVIDSDAGQICNTKQNPLNWSATSGAVAVHDENGQFLGNLVEYGPSNDVTVYSPTLNRVIDMTGSFTDPSKLIVYPGKLGGVLYYTTTDCSGQAYIPSTDIHAKTQITRWPSGGSEVYGTVSNNATASSMTPQSELDYFGNVDSDDDFGCESSSSTGSFYPATTVTLPFTVPAQGPVEF